MVSTSSRRGGTKISPSDASNAYKQCALHRSNCRKRGRASGAVSGARLAQPTPMRSARRRRGRTVVRVAVTGRADTRVAKCTTRGSTRTSETRLINMALNRMSFCSVLLNALTSIHLQVHPKKTLTLLLVLVSDVALSSCSYFFFFFRFLSAIISE